MSEPLSVSVIGPGALGSAVIDLIMSHPEFNLRSVWGRTQNENYFIDSSDQPHRRLETDLTFPSGDTDLGQLIIITVPDNQIKAVSERLSGTSVTWKRRQVIHMSGSLDTSVLESLATVGADTGSLHPLQTFTRGDLSDRFDEIWFTMQGSDEIVSILDRLIDPCGGRRKVLSSDQKSAMHLAAVFASNYLVALMNVVEQITRDSDISNGFEMLEPIVQQTIKNINSKGSGNSLSGPVARGDTSTIENHLKQLEGNLEYQTLYSQLGLIASDIAKESGQLDKSTHNTIRDLLVSVQKNR